MAKRMKDPETIVDKMITRASNAVEDVVQGIMDMTETPGVQAAKKKDKYLSGVQRAVADNSYVDGNLGYTLQEFQDVAVPKVRERYASGMEKSRPKAIAARQQLNVVQQKIKDAVAAMPDDTEAQRDARQKYAVTEMRKFKLQRRRR